MPKWMRNAATIAAALNTLFVIACLQTARDKKQLNGKEGTVMMKGAQTPPAAASAVKSPQERGSGGMKSPLQTPFLNLDPFQ